MDKKITNKEIVFELILVSTFVAFSIVFRLLGSFMPLYLSFDIFVSCFFVYFLKKHLMAFSYLFLSSLMWFILGIATDVNFLSYILNYLIPNLSCYLIFVFSDFIDNTKNKSFDFKYKNWIFYSLFLIVILFIRIISIVTAGALFYLEDTSYKGFIGSLMLNWPVFLLEFVLVLFLVFSYKFTFNLKSILFNKYF